MRLKCRLVRCALKYLDNHLGQRDLAPIQELQREISRTQICIKMGIREAKESSRRNTPRPLPSNLKTTDLPPALNYPKPYPETQIDMLVLRGLPCNEHGKYNATQNFIRNEKDYGHGPARLYRLNGLSITSEHYVLATQSNSPAHQYNFSLNTS